MSVVPFGKRQRQVRAVIQIITIARFRRPRDPKRCNVHAYHVWRWETFVDDGPRMQPIDGMKCQCGCLTREFRPEKPEAQQ